MNKVIIRDYTEYESGKSCNGGCYAFYTYYNRVGEDTWQVSYDTSADFSYCPKCGEFCNNDCDNCTAEFDTVSTEKVLKMIKKFENEPDYEVEVIV